MRVVEDSNMLNSREDLMTKRQRARRGDAIKEVSQDL
jgi:hypothetical protein